MYQSGRAGDEAKKRKSPAKSGSSWHHCLSLNLGCEEGKHPILFSLHCKTDCRMGWLRVFKKSIAVV